MKERIKKMFIIPLVMIGVLTFISIDLLLPSVLGVLFTFRDVFRLDFIRWYQD